MRAPRFSVISCVVLLAACSKHPDKSIPECATASGSSLPQCNLPQCMDGIDNDGDGLIDYPDDPGCSSPYENSELDDCPEHGPNCPQCGNHIDDDKNGIIDFSGGDPGCSAASDPVEFTENPRACGSAIDFALLPIEGGQVINSFGSASVFPIVSPCGGGGGGGILAMAYELHLIHSHVIVASTEGSTVDTVLDVRGLPCLGSSSEIACNDNVSTTDMSSQVTASLDPGTYFILVESKLGIPGPFTLTVQELPGEGAPCMTGSDCGPGLVCRVPLGGSAMVCSKPECSDGVDNDGDGLIDYPNDPGCLSPDWNSELDDCPTDGPYCPQCGNHKDDNGDGKIDYAGYGSAARDPKCKAASNASEWCTTTEGVAAILQPMFTGDLTGASDDYTPSCAFGTGGVDLTYALNLPKMTSLTINVTDPTNTIFPDSVLLPPSCKGGSAELACENDSPITVGSTTTPLAAGLYYLVVDGDSAGQVGTFTVMVSGTIANAASCESQLALNGAITCGSGYMCKGTVGSRTCQP